MPQNLADPAAFSWAYSINSIDDHRRLKMTSAKISILLFATSLLLCTGCRVKKKLSEAIPIQHELWDTLLQTHVSDDGWVDYSGFRQDSQKLKTYLQLLSKNHPNDKHWSKDEQLAYWINAYNAYTVKIVADHYPVSGIKDIKNGIPFVNTVWDIKFIQIENHSYDLNNIEHGIIRKHFNEPRIHFAVNCASYSCPALINRAFTATSLDQQLDDAARRFINDPLRNHPSKNPAQLSKIFSWFKGDFTKNDDLKSFVNKYAIKPISADAKIQYLDYDWSLNDQQ